MGLSAHQKNGGHDEWLTPPKILQALGPFDLDPCAPMVRPWETAARHYTVQDDGLALPWDGRVWCNPPFGREAVKWLRRMRDHGNGVALIPARTETAMFYETVWGSADGVLFIKGRPHFHYVDGRRAAFNSGAPIALVAYGSDNLESLRQSGLGFVVVGHHRPDSNPRPLGRATLSRTPTEDITMDRITTTRSAIGEAYNGGFFAGLIRIGASTYGLIVAPKSTGETTGEWGPRNAVDSAHSFFDGHANTAALAAAGSDIARWAQALDINGHTDWYIPSRDELEICYRNLKPTDKRNTCYSGDNPSAYLPAYAYMPDNPTQTAVDIFSEDGAESFETEWYWTSTQYAGYASNAWLQDFDDGGQDVIDKGYQGRVRAVRRFLID